MESPPRKSKQGLWQRMNEVPKTLVQLLLDLVPERARVRIVACLAFLGLAFWIAYSTGMTPLSHGFAKADDLNSLRLDVDQSGISELRAQECHVTDQKTRQFYTQILTKRITDYQKLAGQPYVLPSCDDE